MPIATGSVAPRAVRGLRSIIVTMMIPNGGDKPGKYCPHVCALRDYSGSSTLAVTGSGRVHRVAGVSMVFAVISPARARADWAIAQVLCIDQCPCTNHLTTISAIRSPACPSHSGGMRVLLGVSLETWRNAVTTVARVTSRLVP